MAAEPSDPRRNVNEAHDIIQTAWIAEVGDPDEAPFSLPARQLLLAVSAFEGGFGTSHYANGAPTEDNWGAIHCPGQLGKQRIEPRGNELWSHCVLGVDQNVHGKFDVYFRGYPDGLSGARDFVRLMLKRGADVDTLNSGDSARLARQMYEKHYYGRKKGESHEDAIERYTVAIDASAKRIAKALGQPLHVARGGVAPGETEEGEPATNAEDGGESLIMLGVALFGAYLALRSLTRAMT